MYDDGRNFHEIYFSSDIDVKCSPFVSYSFASTIHIQDTHSRVIHTKTEQNENKKKKMSGIIKCINLILSKLEWAKKAFRWKLLSRYMSGHNGCSMCKELCKNNFRHNDTIYVIMLDGCLCSLSRWIGTNGLTGMENVEHKRQNNYYNMGLEHFRLAEDNLDNLSLSQSILYIFVSNNNNNNKRVRFWSFAFIDSFSNRFIILRWSKSLPNSVPSDMKQRLSFLLSTWSFWFFFWCLPL